MNEHRLGACVLIGIGALIALYFAVSSEDSDNPAVPQVQLQVMGLGVAAGIDYGKGTMLDMRPEVHFWTPGRDAANGGIPCQPVCTPHRYPAVPGGNISTVIHKGFSSLIDCQPAGNDWFFNPPEAAVL